MTTHAHTSYPFLIVYIVNIWLQLPINWGHYFFIALAANMPDLDMIYLAIRHGDKKLKGKADINHHDWFTHWPIVYLPFWILALVTHYWAFVVITFGTIIHLIMDTLYGEVMWLAPFKKKHFSLEPKNLRGLAPKSWLKEYRKLLVYKLDIAASVITIGILVFELEKIII